MYFADNSKSAEPFVFAHEKYAKEKSTSTMLGFAVRILAPVAMDFVTTARLLLAQFFSWSLLLFP